MRRIFVLVVVALAGAAAYAASAAAQPVSGPHEVVDNTATTTQPGAPSGFHYSGTYHAANDPKGDPPYMRKMRFYEPAGQIYDTTVPPQCTASDVELALRGVDACPAGSRLGGGESTSKFMGQFPSTLQMDFVNGKGEQIILAHSPIVTSIARGKILPDGSVQYESPTCFPTVDPVGCPVDNVLQMHSEMNVPAYTKTIDGKVRSYMTTPSTCPASGHWETPIQFWWADGSSETVVTKQPCTQPAAGDARVPASHTKHAKKHKKHKKRHHKHKKHHHH